MSKVGCSAASSRRLFKAFEPLQPAVEVVGEDSPPGATVLVRPTSFPTLSEILEAEPCTVNPLPAIALSRGREGEGILTTGDAPSSLDR